MIDEMPVDHIGIEEEIKTRSTIHWHHGSAERRPNAQRWPFKSFELTRLKSHISEQKPKSNASTANEEVSRISQEMTSRIRVWHN